MTFGSSPPALPHHLAVQALTGGRELEGERKTVTVLFADLVGSTALAGDRDPEEVVEILNGLFAGWVEAVHRYEGMVDKFLGDGMLALFGAPLVHEDDPRRAVHAGLEIVAWTRHRAETVSDIDLDVRVGLNTGTVVVGTIGSDARMEYTAIGDAVNVAQRVESSATPGSVFIPESTRRLVAPYFEIIPAGMFELKGKASPVQLFEVVADRGITGTIRGVDGLTAPLVGRTAERNALFGFVDQLVSGSGGGVCVVGEAGIGKSRLFAETGQKARAVGLRWIEGHALSYGATTPYLTVREIVRRLGADEEAELFDASTHLDPAARHREIVAATRRLIRAASPLVLVIEDLHWIDEPSLDVIVALCRLAADAEVVVLVNSRPDGADAVDRCGLPVIELEPLDDGESAALMGELLQLDDLPKGVRDIVLRKAQGNPFFLEELLRGLIDGGVIERQVSGWRATMPAGHLAIPESIEGLLASRIDHLPAHAKAVLQACAVVGRDVPLRLIEQMMAVEPGVLEMLVDRGFLVEGIDPTIRSFKHVLTQEAAYGGMLRKTRRRLHRLAGDAIEALFADELVLRSAELARHFDEADEPDRAVPYVVAAAERAAAEYANDAALALVTRGLQLAEGSQAGFELHRIAAGVHLRRGQMDEAAEAIGQMRALAESDPDRRLMLGALVARAELGVKADYLTARASIDEALAEADHQNDAGARGRLLRLLAIHHVSQYAPVRAIEALEEAIGLLEESGLDGERAAAFGQMTRAQAMVGDAAAARRWSERTAELAESIGDSGLVGQAIARSASIAIEAGEFDVALDRLDRAEHIATEIDALELRAQCAHWRATTLTALRRRQESDLAFEKAQELALASGNEWSWMLAVMGMVESWESQQRIGELLGWLAAHDPTSTGHDHLHARSYFHYAIGYRALRWFGAWEEGMAEVKLAVEMVDEGDFQPPRVMFRNGLASLLLESGETDQARQMLDEALEIARRHEAVDVTGPYLDVTDARLALLEGDHQGCGEAVGRLEAASAGWTGAGERFAVAVLRAEVALATDETISALEWANRAVSLEPLSWAVVRFFSTPYVLDLLARAQETAGLDASIVSRQARHEADRWVAEVVPADQVASFRARPEISRILARSL